MFKGVDYFDHDADIGIIGRGDTLEDAFCSAAKATFNIMTDITKVPSSRCLDLTFDENDHELALVTWLNLLIAKARTEGMVFSSFELTNLNGKWQGRACGSAWQEAYSRGTEVKGATLTMLKVFHTDHWEARCIVDV